MSAFADEHSKSNVRPVRCIYFVRCVVVIRVGLQQPHLMSCNMRIFLTKRETFLSASVLYTILIIIVMNAFQ